MNKKRLELLLSRLKTFDKPKVELEQYQTESNIASRALWWAFMNGDIKGKVVADLGCGNGIFGLGALLLGAKKVTFLDKDENNIELVKENLDQINKFIPKSSKVAFVNLDIRDFKGRADVVVQNPPFGVRVSHRDKIFLAKSFEVANKIYTFHKCESEKFIEFFSRDNGFFVNGRLDFKFPIKKTLIFHAKMVYYVDVGCWLLEKKRAQPIKVKKAKKRKL